MTNQILISRSTLSETGLMIESDSIGDIWISRFDSEHPDLTETICISKNEIQKLIQALNELENPDTKD